MFITSFTADEDGIQRTDIKMGGIGSGAAPREMGFVWPAPQGFRAWIADEWQPSGQARHGHNAGIFPTQDAAIAVVEEHCQQVAARS